LLSCDEVAVLDRLYLSVHQEALARRRAEPLARYIHLPKLPEPLSLAIVALTAPSLLGAHVALAPFPHDLVDSHHRRIAVKGTGSTSWISFTASDRAAHVLAWVDYALRISSGLPVRVFEIPIDERLADAPARLTFDQLCARCAPRTFVSFDPASALTDGEGEGSA
jgi:hypothetical protein